MGGDSYARDRELAKQAYIFAKVAKSTGSTYAEAWRAWMWFCRAQRRQPYLLGRTDRELWDDEEAVLDFIVHLADVLRRAAPRSERSSAASASTTLPTATATPSATRDASTWPWRE